MIPQVEFTMILDMEFTLPDTMIPEMEFPQSQFNLVYKNNDHMHSTHYQFKLYTLIIKPYSTYMNNTTYRKKIMLL